MWTTDKSHFPNLNMLEGKQYLKQQKTVETILYSEKSEVMTYLLVRLSSIDYVVTNTFVNQLIFDMKLQQSNMEAAHKDAFTNVVP